MEHDEKFVNEPYRASRNACSAQKEVKGKQFKEPLAIESVIKLKRLFAYLHRKTSARVEIAAFQFRG